MANQNAAQDGNQVFALIAHTGTAGTAQTVRLVADASGALTTTGGGGGGGGTTVTVDHGTITITNSIGGGTQYTSGTTVATPTGNVIMWRDGSNFIREVSSASGFSLPVQLIDNNGDRALNLGAGADTTSNSTNQAAVAGFNLLYNGASWDRVRGDITNGLDVDVTRLPNIPAGTITQIGTVLGIGGTVTVTGASAGTVVQVQTGTIASITEVANLAKGTITRLEGGTVQSNILTGTITSVSNLANGTLAAVTSVTNLASGTLLNSGTTTGVGVVSNLTNGSVNILTGTVTSVTNLAGGTIKINPRPATTIVSAGASGTAAIGTLITAPGSGTSVYITGYNITASSGTPEVCLSFGTVQSGAQSVAKGAFPPGGGIAQGITFPSSHGTSNAPLTYLIISGAGTVNWHVDYWVE